MNKHKWHKEIKAWADGAEIEMFYRQYDGWGSVTDPTWYEENEYRIKPQQQQSSCCPCKQTCSALKEPQYYAVFINHKDEVRFNLWDKLCETPAEYKYAGKIKLEVDDE